MAEVHWHPILLLLGSVLATRCYKSTKAIWGILITWKESDTETSQAESIHLWCEQCQHRRETKIFKGRLREWKSEDKEGGGILWWIHLYRITHTALELTELPHWIWDQTSNEPSYQVRKTGLTTIKIRKMIITQMRESIYEENKHSSMLLYILTTSAFFVHCLGWIFFLLTLFGVCLQILKLIITITSCSCAQAKISDQESFMKAVHTAQDSIPYSIQNNKVSMAA